MFKDRDDAGRQLGAALMGYKDQGVLVLGIARGGVAVAAQAAEMIGAELNLLVTRKLPLPYNPEAGFGAVAEDGSVFMHPWAASQVDSETIELIKEQQVAEIKKRIDKLRGGNPLPPIEGRTVILIDDGIAMGSTVRASLMFCRNQGAAKVVVASPVAGPTAKAQLSGLADEIIILETPPNFMAVAQVYLDWYDMSFEEVNRIMEKWRSGHPDNA
ncbi:MAG: phosphoribosyltransferase [Sedimentisphaeraceae bacterium JB056]